MIKFSTTEAHTQSSFLSPLSYLRNLDEAVKISSYEGVKVGLKKLVIGYGNLQLVNLEVCAFADDILLLAKSGKNLEENLKTRILVLDSYS